MHDQNSHLGIIGCGQTGLQDSLLFIHNSHQFHVLGFERQLSPAGSVRDSLLVLRLLEDSVPPLPIVALDLPDHGLQVGQLVLLAVFERGSGTLLQLLLRPLLTLAASACNFESF